MRGGSNLDVQKWHENWWPWRPAVDVSRCHAIAIIPLTEFIFVGHFVKNLVDMINDPQVLGG